MKKYEAYTDYIEDHFDNIESCIKNSIDEFELSGSYDATVLLNQITQSLPDEGVPIDATNRLLADKYLDFLRKEHNDISKKQMYELCGIKKTTFLSSGSISKKTIFKLAKGLQLSYEESCLLLNAAGYSFNYALDKDRKFFDNMHFEISNVFNKSTKEWLIDFFSEKKYSFQSFLALERENLKSATPEKLIQLYFSKNNNIDNKRYRYTENPLTADKDFSRESIYKIYEALVPFMDPDEYIENLTQLLNTAGFHPTLFNYFDCLAFFLYTNSNLHQEYDSGLYALMGIYKEGVYHWYTDSSRKGFESKSIDKQTFDESTMHNIKRNFLDVIDDFLPLGIRYNEEYIQIRDFLKDSIQEKD